MSHTKNSESEVYASHRSEIKIVYENKDFSVSASTSTDLYGIRSIIDGKPGFLTTNSSDPQALLEAAAEVQKIARLSPAGEFYAIADPVDGGKSAPLIQSDPGIENMGPAGAVNWTQRVIDEARKDDRIAIDRAEFSVQLGCDAIVNSRGVERSFAQSSTSWFVMGMAKSGSQVTSFDYDGAGTDKSQNIEKLIVESVARFRDSVIGSLDPRPAKSYHGQVLLHPQAVLSLFGGLIFSNCSARLHQDGVSAWKDKIGRQVASAALTVFEDPQNASRPEGWMPFDREGIPTSRHELIKNGRLNFLAHNCFTAKRGGTTPTGNASGGARSNPAIGFSNTGILLEKDAGVELLDDASLMKKFNNGLMLKRFSGNSDPVSGRFSGVAKNSRMIEDGKIAYPVEEIMISGSLFDIVNQIIAGGQRQHIMQGGSLAPFILVDGLSVTAG